MAIIVATTALATSPTVTWTNGGADFNNGGNWTGGSPGASTLLRFDSSVPIYQPTLLAPAAALGLVFTSNAGAFTIAGTGPLTLGDSAITNDSSAAQTIAVPLIFAAGSSYHWIRNEGTLTLSGTISTSSGTWFKLAGSGANGTVSGAISGTDDVVKYESGTWTLSGSNTFTGALLVEQGTLNLTGTNTTTDVDVYGGAVLNLNAANTLASGADVYVYGLGTLNVNFSQTIAKLESGSSGSQAMVNLASGTTLTIDVPADHTGTFEGVIADATTGAAGAITKTGVGRQVFSGLNTYTGITRVTGGTLDAQSLFDGGVASSLGASGNAAANLVLDGGTLRYTGATNGSTDRLFTLGAGGGTIDSAGTGVLNFTNPGALAFQTSSASATLTLDSGSNYGANTFAPIIADASSGVTSLRKNGIGQWVLSAANTFTGTTQIDYGTLTLGNSLALQNSTVTPTQYGNLTFRGIASAAIGGLGGASQASLSLLNDAANPTAVALTVGGNNQSTTYAGTLTGSGSLTKTGTGTLTLSGTNTYAGGTTLNAGTLTVSNDAALGASSGDLTFGGGTLKLGSGLTSARAITLGTGGGTISTNSYEGTFPGVISGGGALTFKGTGILTLSGANTYSGGTTIQDGGVLDFTANNNLGAATGSVTLNGGYLRTRAAIFDFTHPITLGSSGGTFNAYGVSSTISNVINGNGLLTVQSQSDTGLVTLTAANTYTGGTQIGVSGYYSGYLALAHAGGGTLPAGGDISLFESSMLQIASDQTIRGLISNSSTSSVILNAGQTLTINLPDPVTDSGHAYATFGGVLSGGGTLAVGGPGQFTLTGTNTYSGGTKLNAGTLVISQDANLGNASTGLSFNGGTLQTAAALTTARGLLLDANGGTIDTHGFTSTFSGQLTGSGGLTVKSLVTGGVLTLTNATNQYAGLTSVASGTLRIGTSGALGALGSSRVDVASGAKLDVAASQTLGGLSGSGAVNLASGQTLTLDLGQSDVFGGTFEGAGQLTKSSVHQLTLSGAGSTQSGDTRVAAGLLADGAAQAFSANSTIRVNTGASLTVNYVETIAGLDDYTTATSGTVTLGSTGALTVANTTANTFSGTLAGAGTLTKTAVGELIFGGTSTYTGSTAINGGTLTVSAANAFTAGLVTVNNTALFRVAASTSIGSLAGQGSTTVAAGKTLTLKSPQVLSALIGGDGGVTFANNSNANGLTTLTKSQDYLGATTLTFGSLQLGNSTAPVTLAGSLVTGSGTTVIFSHGSTNSTVSQSISGGASVYKHNLGTLTLTGASTYTGTTTVDGGTLKVAVANALPTTTGLTMTANTLLDIAANQTINRFVTTDALSSILIESGQVFDVTLGGLTAGTVFNGVISGAGALEVGPSTDPQGGHALTLTGNNAYTGGTTIDVGGALRIGNGTTQNAAIVGNVLNNGLLIFQTSNNLNFNGVISGSGGLSLGLAKSSAGGGDLRLGSANTYTGSTEIYAGRLFAMNTSGSATGNGRVTVHGGVLAGTGTVSGRVDVLAGGNIAPAAALGQPGTLTVGDTLFAGGGKFVFQINDANGVVGTNLSLLSVVGALNVTATSANPFVVELYSIDTNQTQGLVANFNPAQAYSWQFLTASGGITGFSDKAFGVDPSQFQNVLPTTGGFFVTQTGNNLFLEYSPTAVPEPSTWALLALGAGVLFVAGRRRGTPPQA